ncbi:MAG: carboxyltransferase domain-containing protein, partial [Actinomycetota bacterium]
GVDPSIRAPRKATVVRDVPAGSIIVAGPQALVTTVTMPTGWWVIGRSTTPIHQPGTTRPFRFDPGDRVRFEQIDRATFDRAVEVTTT